MSNYKQVAISPDKTRVIVQDGSKYAIMRAKTGEMIGDWRDNRLLKSMIAKGGYSRIKESNTDNDVLEKSKRKSIKETGIVTNKPSKVDKLIVDLGLQEVSKDVTNPHVWKSDKLVIDLEKAQHGHLPDGAERFSYKCNENYNIVYIPVNRLKEVYQTKEALNPTTIKRKAKEMKSGKAMPPVYIGYNYDVHDGHHSWNAAMENGYTHVPCKVVGSDPEKVKQAIEEYKKVWKGFREDHWQPKSKPTKLVIATTKNTNQKMLDFYNESKLNGDNDESIYEEAINHFDLDLEGEKGLRELYKKNGANIQDHFWVNKSVSLFIDMQKGVLNTGKLVKRRVAVKGKNGQVFYRMQWVDPNQATGDHEHPGVDHSTYGHHTDGIKEMEKRQSNKFPVVHHPTHDLKNTYHNYSTNQQKLSEAEHTMKHGGKLPPVMINAHGEILDNHHLVDLAKKHGLSHVPVVVTGNTNLKKQLEDKLKDQVTMKEPDSNGQEHVIAGNPDNTKPVVDEGSEMVHEVSYFEKFTSKKFTKQYLMSEAKRQGITWNNYDKHGNELPANSSITWMRASMAIKNHIKKGNNFEVKGNEKDTDKRMEQDGKDSIHKHFLKLFEKHGNGDKNEFMEWAKEYGIQWKEVHKDPDINYMRCVDAVKNELRKGKMVDGVRTRQKGVMTEANRIIDDNIKSKVTALGKRHGKSLIMSRAEQLGIQFDRKTKKGDELPENSNILWMRASEAIQRFIADGNEFMMEGQESDNLNTSIGDYGGVKLSNMQSFAVDLGKRASKDREEFTKDWAIKTLMIDNGMEHSEASQMYDQLMKKARDAKLMLHFDPFEVLPGGSTYIDQIMSDGHIKNDYELNRGLDRDSREIDERTLFGDDYDNAEDHERPLYAVTDLFNRGLKSHQFAGDVAFVLNDDVKKRSTGVHQDSSAIPYGEDGKWVRSLQDPHQLLMDRWTSRWKEPKKPDKQRRKAFESVLNGEYYKSDINPFEAHIHGGVDLGRDVSHIVIPESWTKDAAHKEKYSKIQELGKLHNIPVYYEPSEPNKFRSEPTDGTDIRRKLRGY